MSTEYQTQDVVEEPLKEFLHYKNENYHVVSKKFDELLARSGIDYEENQQLNGQLMNEQGDLNHTNAQIKKYRGISGFFIALLILIIIPFIVGIAMPSKIIETANLKNTSIALPAGMIALTIILYIIFTGLLSWGINVYNKRLFKLEDKKKYLEEVVDALNNVLIEQTLPLYHLFKNGLRELLLKETMPFLSLQKTIKQSFADYVFKKFDYDLVSENYFHKYAYSGFILNNPFILSFICSSYIGTKTYYGSLTVSVKKTGYRDGKSYTYYVNEQLRASHTAPYPYFKDDVNITFFNEAANKLSFSRSPSGLKDFSEKGIEKFVNKGVKQMEKRITLLNNHKFEVLFNAFNRNDEQQFRYLMSPLAQTNLVDILTDRSIGYGDNFTWVKNQTVNKLHFDHIQSDIFTTNDEADYYMNIDLKECKNLFLRYHTTIFKQFYFLLAPYLSVNAFAMTEYIDYDEGEYVDGDRYGSEVQHEISAYNSNARELVHPDAKTEAIYKTAFINNSNGFDNIGVVTSSYDFEDRVIYVGVSDSNGNWHNVPVNYKQPFLLTRTSKFGIHNFNLYEANDSSDEYEKLAAEYMNGQKEAYTFKSNAYTKPIVYEDEREEVTDSWISVK
ncbi:MAG1210 family protein [Ureaplasma canigenitalium]|uniref:MAG1210 family protein n=1 Tax=Ureaplasma canigenitalium TaxID=42092 RepID=UPI0004E1B611|nr:hypothetical protein [Ureaplasma canigenitalium]